ncbi:hypothetical protein TCAL_11165 [Tigriopus californicus]|uniref:Purine nucleoside phosphorylase n=1 Tax=Tigriopus californicus TaxID=6832 RepID=A0A553NEU2_TIGCA|nr:purine nucleoside phosphorylase-like [Tigriopus californicus]TRY63967.1 hypothetical protein TCAL_11165 [Tigriopus californicus]|eukprot:TCALIF_11165-PA protein Name:"Similar to PNP Purine nucleoside phosphorylase (Bos taurus)" AED:0.11 eAED:0.11 QI:150/1/1/1/1/1/6/112/305
MNGLERTDGDSPVNEMRNQSMHFEPVNESAQYLLQRTKYRPKVAVICGSGLATLGTLVEKPDVFPYEDIPNFPVSTAPGHKSRLLFGILNGVQVMLMQGRFHLYEGYSIYMCAMPVRVMHLVGIKSLIVSNAAGGLNSKFKVGDVMMLQDHVNLQGFVGINPLAGRTDTRFGPHFFATNHAYDRKWRAKCRQIMEDLGLGDHCREGVYSMVGGPNFETPAELRLLRMLGIDAIGMSTVHEALTAVQCGMSLFAFSLITNACITDYEVDQGASVAEVMETAHNREEDLKIIVGRLVAAMGSETQAL